MVKYNELESESEDTSHASEPRFRVRVCMQRFYASGDLRARAYVCVSPRRRVRWLQRRLRRLFALPRLFLVSRGHLLPPQEPLALLQPDDPVEVIPADVEPDEDVAMPEEVVDCAEEMPVTTVEEIQHSPSPVNSEDLIETKRKALMMLEQCCVTPVSETAPRPRRRRVRRRRRVAQAAYTDAGTEAASGVGTYAGSGVGTYAGSGGGTDAFSGVGTNVSTEAALGVGTYAASGVGTDMASGVGTNVGTETVLGVDMYASGVGTDTISDVGTDAASDVGTDASTEAASDVGTYLHTSPAWRVRLPRPCPAPGLRGGGTDAASGLGTTVLDAGIDADSGVGADAGKVPAEGVGPEAGTHSGTPAGTATDAGTAAGTDAGTDAGTAAGTDAGTAAGTAAVYRIPEQRRLPRVLRSLSEQQVATLHHTRLTKIVAG